MMKRFLVHVTALLLILFSAPGHAGDVILLQVGALAKTCTPKKSVSQRLGFDPKSRIGRFLDLADKRYGDDRQFRVVAKAITDAALGGKPVAVRSPIPQTVEFNIGVSKSGPSLFIDLKYINLVDEKGVALPFGALPTERSLMFPKLMVQVFRGVSQALDKSPGVQNLVITSPKVQNINLWKIFRDMGMQPRVARNRSGDTIPMPADLQAWLDGKEGIPELHKVFHKLMMNGVIVDSIDFYQNLDLTANGKPSTGEGPRLIIPGW